MIDNLLASNVSIPTWILTFLVLGSVVDVFQFVWILKRAYRKIRRSVYNQIKKEIMDNGGKF
jgi:hypothetical protein